MLTESGASETQAINDAPTMSLSGRARVSTSFVEMPLVPASQPRSVPRNLCHASYETPEPTDPAHQCSSAPPYCKPRSRCKSEGLSARGATSG